MLHRKSDAFVNDLSHVRVLTARAGDARCQGVMLICHQHHGSQRVSARAHVRSGNPDWLPDSAGRVACSRVTSHMDNSHDSSGFLGRGLAWARTANCFRWRCAPTLSRPSAQRKPQMARLLLAPVLALLPSSVELAASATEGDLRRFQSRSSTATAAPPASLLSSAGTQLVGCIDSGHMRRCSRFKDFGSCRP